VDYGVVHTMAREKRKRMQPIVFGTPFAPGKYTCTVLRFRRVARMMAA